MIQDLKNSQIYTTKEVKPEGDKRTRMFAHAGMFEAGNVLLPKKAPWLDEFEHELTSFPASKYDDQVDSTSQALQFLRNRLEEPGLLTFYRERMEEERRKYD